MNWRDAILESLTAVNVETIDAKTGLLEDSVIVRRADAGVHSSKVILELGSISANAPGDRATDLVRILGTDDEDLRD